jgi:hypothetical protein
MKLSRTLFSLLAALAASGAATAVGCSTNTVVVQPGGDAGAVKCDPTQCATKNECLPDDKGVEKCRLPCAAQAECPFNYVCAPGTPKNFCVKNTTELQKKDTGLWGTACQPTAGFDKNPACDSGQGFACYAETPTDAAAYCTRYDCTTDLDCAGGFWCATINEAPNATTTKRTLGATRNVCLRRTYCATCKADVDCPKVDGKDQLCATDGAGGGFCTTRCSANNQCALDATCTGDGQKEQVCVPKATVCKGDGSLCAPCLSDADCPNGLCVKANYSTERFCTTKSATACSSTSRGDCPAKAGSVRVSCITQATDPDVPKDHCVGIVRFDDGSAASYVLGCWTGDRITQ